MSISLADKVIIITGASSGIGAATALACSAAGMPVLISGRNEERLASVAQQIEAQGRPVKMVLGDITEPDLSQRLLDTAQQHFGGFYAVFANAGVALDQPLYRMGMEEVRRHFDINFFSSTDLIIRAAQRLIAASQSGHLLSCSSCVAKFTLPGHGVYSATKAAQNHVSRALGMELQDRDIYVSSVMPITTRTDLFSTAATQRGLDGSKHKLPKHAPRFFVQTPERVARAIVKCLRSPRPEVWTSLTVKLSAAFLTLAPRFADAVLRRSATDWKDDQ